MADENEEVKEEGMEEEAPAAEEATEATEATEGAEEPAA